jgi:hypothetical protein
LKDFETISAYTDDTNKKLLELPKKHSSRDTVPWSKYRLYWCLIEFIYRLEIQSVMLVFSTPFVN